ncbi:MAG: toll/interleukin-1 receptor domain-containing protein [Dehalococcoidia bacterium]|nr:toll/interleukin-1 receptor domain-containing protein [Dehalococcoidia bacterium]
MDTRIDERRLQNMPEYDVFISHASEDKDFADPLYQALTGAGLRVWYDRSEIQIGDSLRRSIDTGLDNCRYGVVILSASFIEKDWPQYELDGLVTRQNRGERVILPIWHRVTADDIRRFPSPLTDIVSLNSSSMTLEQIAGEITRRVGTTPRQIESQAPETPIQSFGVFYIAQAGAPRPTLTELQARPMRYYGLNQPGWLAVTSRGEELEYLLRGQTLRLRLDYGNTYQGNELEASQMLASGQPFALTIIDESGDFTYFSVVRNRNPESAIWGQQNRSGWMVFEIDS